MNWIMPTPPYPKPNGLNICSDAVLAQKLRDHLRFHLVGISGKFNGLVVIGHTQLQ